MTIEKTLGPESSPSSKLRNSFFISSAGLRPERLRLNGVPDIFSVFPV